MAMKEMIEIGLLLKALNDCIVAMQEERMFAADEARLPTKRYFEALSQAELLMSKEWSEDTETSP